MFMISPYSWVGWNGEKVLCILHATDCPNVGRLNPLRDIDTDGTRSDAVRIGRITFVRVHMTPARAWCGRQTALRSWEKWES
jgi:hypothetical protein